MMIKEILNNLIKKGWKAPYVKTIAFHFKCIWHVWRRWDQKIMTIGDELKVWVPHKQSNRSVCHCVCVNIMEVGKCSSFFLFFLTCSMSPVLWLARDAACSALLTCSLDINLFIHSAALLDCPCLDIHFPTHWHLMLCQHQLSLITQH